VRNLNKFDSYHICTKFGNSFIRKINFCLLRPSCFDGRWNISLPVSFTNPITSYMLLICIGYSTRELVNIVIHMENFPDGVFLCYISILNIRTLDDISEVLQNVFSFDSFNEEVSKTIYEVFHRYGIFVGKASDRHGKVELAPKMALPDLEILGTLWLPDSMLNETRVRFERKLVVNIARNTTIATTVWQKMGERVVARGAVFSEELFRFLHRSRGTVSACVSSDTYFHILTVNPLELWSYLHHFLINVYSTVMLYRYSFSTPIIMVSKLDLTAVSQGNNDTPNSQRGTPAIIHVGFCNKLFVFDPPNGGLLVDLSNFGVTVIPIPYPNYHSTKITLDNLYSVHYEPTTNVGLCVINEMLLLYCIGQPYLNVLAFRGDEVTVDVGNLPSSIRLIQVFLLVPSLDSHPSRFLL
jgi:hypothetical protein